MASKCLKNLGIIAETLAIEMPPQIPAIAAKEACKPVWQWPYEDATWFAMHFECIWNALLYVNMVIV